MKFLTPILFVLFLVFLSAFVLKAPELAGSSGSSPAFPEAGELALGYNDLFAGSGECAQCHSDLVNSQGESVSIINDWRSSMMANSARDPFWRAKVSHETLENPEHAQVLEDVCSRCHAPQGHFNAHYNGQELYSLEEMEEDVLALDGVSCTVCHQVTETSLGNYSGEIIFGENKTIWGPYADPFPNPMIAHTGYTPAEGMHIQDSRICASCHTLITNTVDLQGVPTGTEFVEQAIYHEWLNSTFQETGIGCRSCHIPELTEEVVISTMPPWLGGRTPFGLHELAGANVFMLRLLRDNIDELGLTATAAQFDTTIARAMEKLQLQSVLLSLEENERSQDTLYLQVSLQNIAGHKLPSGYPSRRVFISLEVSDADGSTVFHSGELNEDYNLVGEDDGYEPHHQVIRLPEEVQVYELVMGNVEMEPTTVLEQAYAALKDNRIPPPGFTTEHPSYDTTLIAGAALEDPDFNLDLAIQGTGRDDVYYHIPTAGYTGNLQVKVRVYYQTVSGKWLEQMFSHTSDEIDAFKNYYEAADKTPVLMAEAEHTSLFTGIPEHAGGFFTVSSNAAGPYMHLKSMQEFRQVAFYALDGRLLHSATAEPCETGCFRVLTPGFAGCAILRVEAANGWVQSEKVVLR